MTYQISFEKDPNPQDVQILGNGIIDYAKEKKVMVPSNFSDFLFVMKITIATHLGPLKILFLQQRFQIVL